MTRLTTPGGTPACFTQSTSSMAVPGTSRDGLTMIEQPAASAGATLRAMRKAGKFHAVKAAAMPMGSCEISMRPPGARLSMMRP